MTATSGKTTKSCNPLFCAGIINHNNMKLYSYFSILIPVVMMLILPAEVMAQVTRPQSKGMYGLTELQVGYGLQGNVQPNEIGFTGLSLLAGYSFTQSFSGGVGVGIQAYNGSNAVPVYLEGGYSFKEAGLGKMRFFVKADAGVLIRVNGEVDQARVFGNPQAGILIPVAYHKELSVSLGFFSQWEQKPQETSSQYQLTNFINAKIGLRFY
jgi:hypothetical protein